MNRPALPGRSWSTIARSASRSTCFPARSSFGSRCPRRRLEKLIKRYWQNSRTPPRFDRKRIMEQVIKDYIIQEFMFDQPNAELTDDQLLLADGIIDSLGIFTLIAFIEQQFGLKIGPEDVILENFESVNKIKALIVARQASNQQTA